MKTLNQKTPLKGEWLITLKIDGVQAVYDKTGNVTSRAAKPLYGLPKMPEGKYEVFINNWEDTVSHVRSRNSPPCSPKNLYQLEPQIDPRLIECTLKDPTYETLQELFKVVAKQGYEGLVIIQESERYKIKAVETYDVRVIGSVQGRGKFEGMLGALQTTMGKVGTGFTNEQRREKWPEGETIEVEAMGLTPAGKFRHPRFVRRRFDK